MKTINKYLVLGLFVILLGFLPNSAKATVAESDLPEVTEMVEKDLEYESSNTLRELSIILSIPVNKLREYLSIADDISEDTTLKELGLADEEIERAKDLFAKQKWNYSWNIVLIGMIVIFTSLALTGILVSQLQRFVRDNKPRKSKRKASKGVSKPQKNVPLEEDKDNIIAAIAALQIHIQEAEESEKMIIAWSREPVSVWKASGKLQTVIRNR